MLSTNPIHLFSPIPIFYSFVFTTRFLILDLFLTTAEIRMFLKVFLILLDSNKTAVSSANMLSISFLNSSKDPGKIQHSLSLSCFWGRRAVGHTESFLAFLFDTEIEYGQHLFALPLEKAPS